ncbi:MAG: hypothetical protein ACR65R_17270 [Methylomicrobium sp.]
MSRIVERWMDAELVYEENNYFLRVLFGSQIRSAIKLIAENDDDAKQKARRAIHIFLA